MDCTTVSRNGHAAPCRADAALQVRIWPGLRASGALLGPDLTEPSGAPTGASVEELAAMVESVQLRGRGGAGFPFAVKLRAVDEQSRASGRPAVVVLNGEEGEPASAKDRVLMTLNPRVALDGLRLVAAALGAERTYAYISDPVARLRVAEAAQAHRDPGLQVVAAVPGYVSGEESAVVRALSGGPAKPTHKPPRAFEFGVEGLPTLVSNVETLAHVARARSRWLAGRGAAIDRPSVLLTVSSDRGLRSVVEVPDSVTLHELLEWQGLSPARERFDVLLGGFFGRFAEPRTLRRSLRELASRAHPDVLGCGVVLVLQDTCPVTAVAQVLHYLDRENAQQCGPCFKGIPSMARVVDDLASGRVDPADLERLAAWGTGLRGRGACGTLDAACGIVTSLLEQRADLVGRHLDRPCPACALHPERPTATSFAVPWPSDIKEET